MRPGHPGGSLSRPGHEAHRLDDLPPGVRVRISLDGEPVEVVRTAAGVRARSLTCTHTGCEVTWVEATNEYVCPCHDARFDADGRVLWGPPREPLAPVTARIEGAEAILGDLPSPPTTPGSLSRSAAAARR